MKRWYLVRHAETIWNRDNRIQGSTDAPLSPHGLRQAECLRSYFASVPIQAIVSSNLDRCRHTAKAIAMANGHKLTLQIEPELREIHLGAWEGLTPEEVNAKYPDAYTQWRQSPSKTVIPDAEALDVFHERVRRIRKRLLETLTASEAVIVTHGGVIAALLADALHADYDHLLRHMRIDNTGITAVEFAPQGTSNVLWINRISHLDGLIDAAGPHSIPASPSD